MVYAQIATAVVLVFGILGAFNDPALIATRGNMIYLFDIDGTLADLRHRLHFIQDKPANWDAFFEACSDDCPIEDVVSLCRVLSQTGARIILVSGRSDAVRDKTIRWLKDFDVLFDSLYMRKAGDHRQDNIVKSELLDQVLADCGWEEIAGVFEDRDQVVEMYRQRGLRVYQVADGDF